MVQGSGGASVVGPSQLIDDVILSFNSWVSKFFKGSWVRSIVEERMTKSAYISSLNEFYYGIHQLVTMLSFFNEASDYSNFLKDAQLKQRLLISDFNYLGLPTPLANQANPKNKSSLLLSVIKPLVLGGVIAKMDRMFVKHLSCLVASWGIRNSECAIRYIALLSQHENYWSSLEGLVSEQSLSQHQEFLHELNIVMQQVEQALNAMMNPLPVRFEGVANVE